MIVAVVGLWHLGAVTAACLANTDHEVIAYDPDENVINEFKQGKPPLFEPGLDALLKQKAPYFTSNPNDLEAAELVWVTFDTPVDEQDIADIDSVFRQIEIIIPYLKTNAILLISSQLPVGSTRKCQAYCNIHFPYKQIQCAYSPENLRLGKAIHVFTHPDRVVIGIDSATDKSVIQDLFAPFTTSLIWMSIESAEMTKHALNAFLATSVTFINELATLCEQVGANAREVELGLKSEERIGPKAYLRPGSAFAGGTLARDVNYLIQIGHQHQLPTPFFSAILDSNEKHKQWACRRISEVLHPIKGKTITALGLTYKANTDTLRRSSAIETCAWLHEQGANIVAYDPSVQALPQELMQFIDLKSSLDAAINESDAIIITTEYPEFTALTATDALLHANQPCIFDPSGFLAKHFTNQNHIRYFTVGMTI